MARDQNLEFLSSCFRNIGTALLIPYGSKADRNNPLHIYTTDINREGEIGFLLPAVQADKFNWKEGGAVRLHYKDQAQQFHINVLGMVRVDEEKMRHYYYRNISGPLPVWVRVKIQRADYVEYDNGHTWIAQLSQNWKRLFRKPVQNYKFVQ